MSNGGEAADQVVRLVTDGAEFVLKISGEAAKEIAAFLYAAFQDRKGKPPSAEILRGRESLKNMLKTGKPTELFRVEDKKMKEFAKEAKRYGVGFTMMRGRNKSIGGFCDITVFHEDAPKIARILENMDIIAKQKAKMEHAKAPEKTKETVKDPTEALIESLKEKPSEKENDIPENPTAVRAETAAEPKIPSEPSSKVKADTISKNPSSEKKQSVREKLNVIQKEQQNAKTKEIQNPKKEKPAQQNTHMHHKKKKKHKSKKKGGR